MSFSFHLKALPTNDKSHPCKYETRDKVQGLEIGNLLANKKVKYLVCLFI